MRIRMSAAALALALAFGGAGCFGRKQKQKITAPPPTAAARERDSEYSFLGEDTTPIERNARSGTVQPARLDRRAEEQAKRQEAEQRQETRLEFANDKYSEGVGHLQRGRTQQAIRSFRDAIHLNPQEPAFFAKLGDALLALGNTGAAIEAWDEAERLLLRARATSETGELAIQRDLARLCFSRAQVLASLGRVPEGRQNLERSLEYDATFAPTLAELGQQALERQDPSEAERYFRQAEQSAPDLVNVQLGLAIIEYERRDAESALRRLDFIAGRGYAVDPDLYNSVRMEYLRQEQARRNTLRSS